MTERERKIDDWQRATFPSATLQDKRAKLFEEVEEAYEALSAYLDKPTAGRRDALMDELADVVIVCTGIAALLGLSLDNHVGDKFARVVEKYGGPPRQPYVRIKKASPDEIDALFRIGADDLLRANSQHPHHPTIAPGKEA